MIIPMRAGCMVAYSIIMWMSLARAGGGVLTLVVLVSVLVGLGLKPSCTGLSINPCRRAGVPSITMNSASSCPERRRLAVFSHFLVLILRLKFMRVSVTSLPILVLRLRCALGV